MPPPARWRAEGRRAAGRARRPTPHSGRQANVGATSRARSTKSRTASDPPGDRRLLVLVRHAERRTWNVLARDVEALAAGRQHREPGTRASSASTSSARFDHVLAVVEDQERLAAGERRGQELAGGRRRPRGDPSRTRRPAPRAPRPAPWPDEPDAVRIALPSCVPAVRASRVLPTPPVPRSVTTRWAPRRIDVAELLLPADEARDREGTATGARSGDASTGIAGSADPAGCSGPRPCLSIRYRSWLRLSPSRAAARETFHPVSRRACVIRSDGTSSGTSDPPPPRRWLSRTLAVPSRSRSSKARGGRRHLGGLGEERGAGDDVLQLAALPGHSYARRAARASAVSVCGGRAVPADASRRNRSASGTMSSSAGGGWQAP